MALSAYYLSEIKSFEGYTPVASPDFKQHSVGYGTRAAHPGETITRAEAERRFQAEIGEAERLVARFAPHVGGGAKAALTSLTYNAGPGWMQSGLGAAIKRGDFAAAREIFVQYNKAGGETLQGLNRRRLAEVSWFDHGNSGRSSDPQLTGAEALADADAVLHRALPADRPANAMPDAKGLPGSASYHTPELHFRALRLQLQAWDALLAMRSQETSDV